MNQIHGQYSIRVEGTILIAKLLGSFNEQGIALLLEEMKKHIVSFRGKPFGYVINDLRQKGVTPEGYKKIQAFHEWIADKNFVCKAIVTTSTVEPYIHDKYLPSSQDQEVKYFNNVEDAFCWVQERLKSE